LVAGGLVSALLVASPLSSSVGAVPDRAAGADAVVRASAVHRQLVPRSALAAFPSVARGSATRAANDVLAVTESGLYRKIFSGRPGARTNTGATPSVSSTPIAGSSGVSASTQGLNLFDQRTANGGNQFTVVPPDQGVCASSRFVIEVVNDVIRVYDTQLNPISGVVDLNTFYGYEPAINRDTGVIGPSLTDPSCIYDAEHQRFVVVELTLDVDPGSGALLGSNHLDFAVSKTSNPTGGWNLYSLAVQDDGTQGTPAHTDCPCIGDYPHIGQDANGIYVTTNEYPLSSAPGTFGNNYDGAQLYAFSKAALTSGAPTVGALQFQTLLADGTPGFTVWPAQAAPGRYATANNGTEYFAQTNAAAEALGSGAANNLLLWSLTNTASLNTSTPAPVLHARFLASEAYEIPPLSTQKAGPTPLGSCVKTPDCGGAFFGGFDVKTALPGQVDSLDSRMQQTWFDGGRLWGEFGTGLNVNGRLRAGAAWFVIDVVSRPANPHIAAQGYVGNANNNLVMPSIAVLPGGKGVMSLTAVGDTLYPSSAFVRVDATGPHGPVNLAARGAGPTDDFCEYNFFDCAGNVDPPLARPRWGDYGAVVPIGNQLLIANEYIGQSCTLGQWVEDPTCGNTRVFFGNWATRLSKVNP